MARDTAAEPGGVHDGVRQIAATGEYGPMRGVIGRVRLLSPRAARGSTPGGTGACYDFLYCIKARPRRARRPQRPRGG
jgi:hypothetical protein